MSEQGPTPAARHGLISLGGGIALAIAFFLPAVEGCGMELSMADLAQEEAAHFYIYAIAAGIALLAGFSLVAQGARARWTLLAQGLAGGLAELHLGWHVFQEMTDELRAEPLWGFWVLVASVLVVGFQPWWSYTQLDTPEGGSPKKTEDHAESPGDQGATPPGPVARSHLPARIAGAVVLATCLAAAWTWAFGEIIGSMIANEGQQALVTVLPWLSGLGTLLAAASGRLLSGGRAIALSLGAGLATTLLLHLGGLAGLEGRPSFMVHAVIFGLLAGAVGGYALGSRRAMIAGALAGMATAVGLTLVPDETSRHLESILTNEGNAALRRALWWSAVLIAEATALHWDRRAPQGDS